MVSRKGAKLAKKKEEGYESKGSGIFDLRWRCGRICFAFPRVKTNAATAGRFHLDSTIRPRGRQRAGDQPPKRIKDA
jgi:hypothetical protein